MEISEGGMFIDVDSDTHGVVSLNGTNSSEKTLMQQSGIVGSYMEHSIFEQMFKVPSVSTIKILQEANSSGIPIYTVNKDNISTVLPKLQIDESVKTDVSNAVNSGKVVTIPQRNIQYFNWNGTGYIVMDPATGAAGYMISGGLAGGSFSVERFLGKLCQAIVTMAIIAGALMLCSFLAGFIVTPMLYFAVDLLLETITEYLTLMFYISFIDTAVEFASDPSGEKFEDVLIDALFVGFGLYLNGSGDETSGGKGIIDVLKEIFPDFFEKTGDMGIEDEVAATFIEKCGSESAALEDIETFEGQGLSDERITEISEELNTEEIDTFKDILNDDPGKYTDTDYAKIQDLLEQCGTKAEMDELRNNIDQLDEYGIKPSDYESMGIDAPERVKGAAEAVANAKYTRVLLQSMRGFMDDATSIIESEGLSVEEFNSLRTQSADLLSENQKAKMKAIRESVPAPTSDTLMQKVIPKADIDNYINNGWDTVRGYTTRAQDTKQLANYSDLFDSLRLNYDDTKFKPSTDTSMGVIRFKTQDVSNFKPPYSESMGGTISNKGWPFTGNGFTAAENGQIIPEYCMLTDSTTVNIMDGAEMYEVFKDGTEILRAVFKNGKFIPIGE